MTEVELRALCESLAPTIAEYCEAVAKPLRSRLVRLEAEAAALRGSVDTLRQKQLRAATRRETLPVVRVLSR